MHAQIPKFVCLLVIGLNLWACGGEPVLNYRKDTSSLTGADAVVERSRIPVTFTLPARDAEASAMNGYYYSFVGEGSECPKGEAFEELGSYVDGKTFQLKLTSFCNYAFVMKFGVLDANAPAALRFALTAKVDYETSIKPLVAKNCVSCHETFADYKELVAKGDMILQQLEAGLMPQTGPLPDADIATFLAWKDGGYLEKDPTAAPTAKELSLRSVFYRNNNNDRVMGYEMLGLSEKLLRRSLWMQDDAKKLGFKISELHSYTNQTAPVETAAP